MSLTHPIPKTRKNPLIAFTSTYLMVFITAALINKFSAGAEHAISALNASTSLIQAPLMLLILMNLTEKSMIKNLIKACLAFLLSFSVFSLAMRGMGEHHLFMIMMVGSIPVVIFSSLLFADHVKQNILEKKGYQEIALLGGIVFAFGSHLILLLLNRINPESHEGEVRILLGLITVISGSAMAVSLAFPKKEERKARYRTAAQVGSEQWKNFSLASTPDVIKKGVTDISKYYAGLQKTN